MSVNGGCHLPLVSHFKGGIKEIKQILIGQLIFAPPSHIHRNCHQNQLLTPSFI